MTYLSDTEAIYNNLQQRVLIQDQQLQALQQENQNLKKEIQNLKEKEKSKVSE